MLDSYGGVVMKEIEKFRSIWLGTKYVSIGDSIVKGKEVMFKKVGGVPFLNPFVPVLANADSIPFQERKLWNPGIGDTGIKVRIYMSDLRLDKYYAMINPQDLNTIAHLKKENEALYQEIERLFEMLYDVSNEDRWKKRIKKEMDNYNAIKGFGYGGGGGYGGFNSFGGGFNSGIDENQM